MRNQRRFNDYSYDDYRGPQKNQSQLSARSDRNLRASMQEPTLRRETPGRQGGFTNHNMNFSRRDGGPRMQTQSKQIQKDRLNQRRQI